MILTEAKILEMTVYTQFRQFLEDNQIIYDFQSGFRRNHSCETLVNIVVSNWKEAVHDKKIVVAVFLDFKRAFETIDRDILLLKLRELGIDNLELQWFQSYLNGRTQRTKINEVVSTPIDVSIGVPQGTILGVVLFLLYINDIHKSVEWSTIFLFADDALLYVVEETIEEGTMKINNDLAKLDVWCKMNKMKLNISKTKCMFINSNEDSVIHINNQVIETVNEIKYLGIIIDNKLDFKNNLDYVCKKIAKKIHFLYSIRKNISMNTAINIYNVIIKPHFEYCSSILFMCNIEMMSRLQKLQNKGMRCILKVNKYTSINLMLQTLNWLSVEQRIKMNILIFIFKMKHKMLPNYLYDKLVFCSDVHDYGLRNRNDFRIKMYNNEKTKNMILCSGLSLFNKLPSKLKNETSLKVFKRSLVDYCKENF